MDLPLLRPARKWNHVFVCVSQPSILPEVLILPEQQPARDMSCTFFNTIASTSPTTARVGLPDAGLGCGYPCPHQISEHKSFFLPKLLDGAVDTPLRVFLSACWVQPFSHRLRASVPSLQAGGEALVP